MALILGFSCALLAKDDSKDEEVVKLDTFVVVAPPLGFIGVKHFKAMVGLLGVVSKNAKLKGLLITEVIDDSPAQRAGLKANDKVLQIDGRPISEYSFNSLMKFEEKQCHRSIQSVPLWSIQNVPPRGCVMERV
jgi:membrane-associated protease RseP (regulator of RpoE activity)